MFSPSFTGTTIMLFLSFSMLLFVYSCTSVTGCKNTDTLFLWKYLFRKNFGRAEQVRMLHSEAGLAHPFRLSPFCMTHPLSTHPREPAVRPETPIFSAQNTYVLAPKLLASRPRTPMFSGQNTRVLGSMPLFCQPCKLVRQVWPVGKRACYAHLVVPQCVGPGRRKVDPYGERKVLQWSPSMFC